MESEGSPKISMGHSNFNAHRYDNLKPLMRFYLFDTFSSALLSHGPNSLQMIVGALPRGKWPCREDEHSSPFRAKIKHAWRFPSSLHAFSLHGFDANAQIYLSAKIT